MAEESFANRAAKQRDTAILQSLLARFTEYGCFATTLDQVASEVGVGKGTLYRHYTSREDLFEAALRAGIEALMVRCRSIWETHAADSDAAFRALIGELVALNHRGDPLSPATLSRLGCSCQWLNRSQPNGKLEAALAALVREWQAAGVLDKTTDSSWIAAVTVALVNSLAVTRQDGTEPAAPSVASTEPPGLAHEADIASRLVEVLRRAFTPPPHSPMAVMGP